jgi:cyclic-di-GMP phosphodiesterase TipF (flagellum assembly factor)
MLPAEYLPAAEPEGLVSAIDNLLLFRCVQIVRRLAKQDRKVGIFCNISLHSLGTRSSSRNSWSSCRSTRTCRAR